MGPARWHGGGCRVAGFVPRWSRPHRLRRSAQGSGLGEGGPAGPAEQGSEPLSPALPRCPPGPGVCQHACARPRIPVPCRCPGPVAAAEPWVRHSIAGGLSRSACGISGPGRYICTLPSGGARPPQAGAEALGPLGTRPPRGRGCRQGRGQRPTPGGVGEAPKGAFSASRRSRSRESRPLKGQGPSVAPRPGSRPCLRLPRPERVPTGLGLR